jgi:hypothetical protein
VLVNRVKRRIPIRMDKLPRSTNDVLMWLGSGLPATTAVLQPMQVAGL